MITYCLVNVSMYSSNDIKTRIAKIDAIISQLEDTALVAAMNGDTVEYTLDTGQTKVNKVYTTPKQINDAISAYELTRSRLVLKLQPRMVRLVDIKNFGR